MLTIASLCLVTQASAQFDDEGGPGGFDPPPPNDVPLDTYQWVMMGLTIIYGLYIFLKHHKKNTPASSKINTVYTCAIDENSLNNQL